jgi:hypothetical protein
MSPLSAMVNKDVNHPPNMLLSMEKEGMKKEQAE